MTSICSYGNVAKRRYFKSSLGVGVAHIGLALVARLSFNHWQPHGWHLYLVAVLPCIPLLFFGYFVARYLRDERDEYQRDLMIRSMLWGTLVTLSLTVFTSFLRAFGAFGTLPPLTEFIVFWMTAGLAQLNYKMDDRVQTDG